MRKAGRFALTGACALALTGFRWTTQLPVPAATPTRAYLLVDQRDPKSLKSGFESLMITNCAYGSMRIGDNDIEPHLASLLEAALGARFGDRLAGKTVDLRGFSVHLNNAIGLREGVRAMYGSGLADMLLNKKKVGCAAEDLIGGYTVGEVAPGIPPVVVAIDVAVDGERFFGRAVAESPKPVPPRKGSPQDEKDQWNAAVGKAVAGALADLGDKIEGGLSSTGAPTVPPASARTQ